MPLFVKLIFIVGFALIFFSLGKALFSLLRGSRGNETVKALSWRVGLSIGLFVLIWVLFVLGIIKPHELFR